MANDDRLLSDRFPRSSKYHPDWIISCDREQNRLWEPIAVCHNSHSGNGVATHQRSLAHVLTPQDPDLAFIMETWDRLADQCKARLIEIIRENLPS